MRAVGRIFDGGGEKESYRRNHRDGTIGGQRWLRKEWCHEGFVTCFL